MSRTEQIAVGIGFLLVGFSAGFDFVLSHGFSEAWQAWGERQWQVSFAVIFAGAGIVNIAGVLIYYYLADRRRYRARKAYGERYR